MEVMMLMLMMLVMLMISVILIKANLDPEKSNQHMSEQDCGEDAKS